MTLHRYPVVALLVWIAVACAAAPRIYPAIDVNGRPFAPAPLLPRHSLSGDDLRTIGGVEFVSLHALAQSMGGTLRRSPLPGADLVLEAPGYCRHFSLHKPHAYWSLPHLIELVPELADVLSASVAPHVGSREALPSSRRSASLPADQRRLSPFQQWLYSGYVPPEFSTEGVAPGFGYWPGYYGGTGSHSGYSTGGGGAALVRGYYRDDGTYVRPHLRWAPGAAQSSAHSFGGGGTVSVRDYTRKDGTYVRPHTRRAPRR